MTGRGRDARYCAAVAGVLCGDEPPFEALQPGLNLAMEASVGEDRRVKKLTLILCLAAGALACGTASTESDDEDEAPTAEGALLAGRVLSELEVATLVRRVGFPEEAVGRMVCTAKYESRFFERAEGHNTDGTTDYGLFQINGIHVGEMAGCPARGKATALFDAETNTRCALAVFRRQTSNAWVAYQKHKAECDAYRAPGSSLTDAAAPSAPSGGGASGVDGSIGLTALTDAQIATFCAWAVANEGGPAHYTRCPDNTEHWTPTVEQCVGRLTSFRSFAGGCGLTVGSFETCSLENRRDVCGATPTCDRIEACAVTVQ